MKVTAYKFNGILFEGSFRQITIELKVTKQMIQSVIDKSTHRKWKITHCGIVGLSNKLRDVSIMECTVPAYLADAIFENLLIQTDNTRIEYYRANLEKEKVKSAEYAFGKNPNCLVFNRAEKTWQLKRFSEGAMKRDPGVKKLGNIIVTSSKVVKFF